MGVEYELARNITTVLTIASRSKSLSAGRADRYDIGVSTGLFRIWTG